MRVNILGALARYPGAMIVVNVYSEMGAIAGYSILIYEGVGGG